MELHPDQKVCIRCGALTVKGGGFDYGIKDPWRPTPKMIKIAAGVSALLILVLVLYSLRTIPPDVVATQWFDAMVSRRVSKADKLVTPKFQENLLAKQSSMMALADDYYSEVADNQAKYAVGAPKYDKQQNPNKAAVLVSVNYGEGSRQHLINLVKVGRQWRIDEAF